MRSAVVFNFLIEANIMASIAILLMIPLRKLLRKQLGSGALCFGWLLVALRLLLPISLVNPLIHEIRSPYADDAGIRPIAGQIKVRAEDAVRGLSNLFWRTENRGAYEAVNQLNGRMVLHIGKHLRPVVVSRKSLYVGIPPADMVEKIATSGSGAVSEPAGSRKSPAICWSVTGLSARLAGSGRFPSGLPTRCPAPVWWGSSAHTSPCR